MRTSKHMATKRNTIRTKNRNIYSQNIAHNIRSNTVNRNLPSRPIKSRNITTRKRPTHLQSTRVSRKRKLNVKKVRAVIIIILAIIILCIYMSQRSKKENVETLSVIGNIDIENKDIEVGSVEAEEQQPTNDNKITDWKLLLVNKDNLIPEDYEVDVKNIESGHKADSRVAESITQMLKDARKEGLNPLICSSYRSNANQKKLYNQKINQYKKEGLTEQEAKEKASYWVAIPGTSEHETGLAFDIVSMSYQILDEKQEETKEQKWLMENCQNYGFVLRYPTDKKEITQINYEPWHYRYVGIENAKFMKERGFCLEEYIEYLKNAN